MICDNDNNKLIPMGSVLSYNSKSKLHGGNERDLIVCCDSGVHPLISHANNPCSSQLYYHIGGESRLP